eukprot:g1289.t1
MTCGISATIIQKHWRGAKCRGEYTRSRMERRRRRNQVVWNENRIKMHKIAQAKMREQEKNVARANIFIEQRRKRHDKNQDPINNPPPPPLIDEISSQLSISLFSPPPSSENFSSHLSARLAALKAATLSSVKKEAINEMIESMERAAEVAVKPGGAAQLSGRFTQTRCSLDTVTLAMEESLHLLYPGLNIFELVAKESVKDFRRNAQQNQMNLQETAITLVFVVRATAFLVAHVRHKKIFAFAVRVASAAFIVAPMITTIVLVSSSLLNLVPPEFAFRSLPALQSYFNVMVKELQQDHNEANNSLIALKKVLNGLPRWLQIKSNERKPISPLKSITSSLHRLNEVFADKSKHSSNPIEKQKYIEMFQIIENIIK